MALCFNNEFCTCVIRIFIFSDCTRLFCTGVGEVKGRTMSSAEELMTNDEIAVNFFIRRFAASDPIQKFPFEDFDGKTMWNHGSVLDSMWGLRRGQCRTKDVKRQEGCS